MFVFEKTQRLLKKSEYDYVFEQAKKVVTNEFIVLYRKNDLGYARLGLAIAKKKIAKAHDRNWVKRLIREQFRQASIPSIDLIFLAKNGIVKQKNSDINLKLSKIWEKLGS